MSKLKITLSIVLMLCFAITAGAQVKKQPVKKTTVKTTQVKKTTVKTKTTTTPAKMVPGTRVKITTDLGVMVLRLYDQTPKHRDNFIKLAGDHFFDSLLFHRVIQGFMIQGGDPLSKNAAPNTALGMGDVGSQQIVQFYFLLATESSSATTHCCAQLTPVIAVQQKKWYII